MRPAYRRRAALALLSALTASGGLVAVPSLQAGDAGFSWMAESDLRATFDGKTVEGEYPGGSSFRETYEGGGKVAYEDEVRASGGRWTIQGGNFCTIYDDDPSGGCFRVRKAGKNCFEFYFIARTEEKAQQPGLEAGSWTARAWLNTEDGTCQQEIGA